MCIIHGMKAVCRVASDGLAMKAACSLAFYKREASPFWWVRCYVEGERGRLRRWSTGVPHVDDGSLDIAKAQTEARLRYPLMPLDKRERRGRAPSVIYFVRAGDYVKIGITRDLPSRFAKMKADSPLPLELLGHRLGVGSDERELHRAFSKRRAHGEWFFACEAIEAEARRIV